MGSIRNGEVSFWWRQLGAPTPRPALPGSAEADVCIVGAGYTGLWTAYYLKQHQPDLRIVVVEQRFAGFGASGRNGGWLTNTVTGGLEQYARSRGRPAALEQQRALNETVAEVLAVLDAEGIDAEVHRGGALRVARNPAQLGRLRSAAESGRRWPGTDLEVLGAPETAARVRVDRALGALWHPHAARIQPAKLVAGLSRAVERRGVLIAEQTRADQIRSRLVVTDHGTVRATHVIRATEGFTADLPGLHRTWLPMNSSMVVTEPLPEQVWSELGWRGHEVLGDFAHAYVYASRTDDGRIAFGGRGVPYRFGSRVDTDGDTARRTVAQLSGLLRSFFPAASQVPIAHAWSGVLAVPRDWSATVGYHRHSGLGWAGGYAGTGVAAANLAGRTLADLVLGRRTALTRLPWVDQRARRWEPEPLRWLAVHGLYASYRYADRQEQAGRSGTAPIVRIADRVAGR